MKFDITATVVDIRPNGTLVLEAHRKLVNSDEQWEYSLSGICRKEDILDGNVVLSKSIAELQVLKRELGSVRDGYRRGWLLRWWDEFRAF
jgi:flagellar L-ring protein precursor FlgH